MPVKLVRGFSGGNDCGHGDVLVVVEQVFAQERFSSVSFSDQDHDFVVVDGRHIEFAEVAVHWVVFWGWCFGVVLLGWCFGGVATIQDNQKKRVEQFETI